MVHCTTQLIFENWCDKSGQISVLRQAVNHLPVLPKPHKWGWSANLPHKMGISVGAQYIAPAVTKPKNRV